MPKEVTLAQLTETLDRVRGMLVHYRLLGPDKAVVDQTLRELDDVEFVVTKAYDESEEASDGWYEGMFDGGGGVQ